MAENEIEPPALGVAWDGTGYGPDGTIWGGEFFLVTNERLSAWRICGRFGLPGGDKPPSKNRAAPRWVCFMNFSATQRLKGQSATVAAFPRSRMPRCRGMLQRRFNSPLTSSVGRLFDAVASLTGLRQQCALKVRRRWNWNLRSMAIVTDEFYDLPLRHPALVAVLDWEPMVEAILSGRESRRCPSAKFPRKFHNALAEVSR